jgi:hypothetical protein
MSTDPAEVAAAMAAGQDAETARGDAGLAAVQGPPPVVEVQGPVFPPLLVEVTGPPPVPPWDEAQGVD